MHQKPCQISVDPTFFDTAFVRRGESGLFEMSSDPTPHPRAPHKLPEPGPEWDNGVNALEQATLPDKPS